MRVIEHDLLLTFYLNPWAFEGFKDQDIGELSFFGCWRYRLGPTNDEGWWLGQCRFSRLAPEWGEFYEIGGDLRLEKLPVDAWVIMGQRPTAKARHFLFYFRDQTFECDATRWRFRVVPATQTTSTGCSES